MVLGLIWMGILAQVSPGAIAGNISDWILKWVSRAADSYRFLNIPIRKYLIQYLGGSLVLSVLIILLAVTVANAGWLTWLMIILAIFFPLVVLGYPLVLRERERRQIDENFHLFITHITVLSLTNTDRVAIFREIADEDDYQSLATEMGRLVAYVDTFNLSLADASRLRANETASDLMSNFYEKLAYSVGSGQSLSSFLIGEQEDVREMYATEYESRLEKLETVGELFLSMSITTAFLFVFAMLMPLLTGTSPLIIFGGVIILYMAVQTLFLLLVSTIAPRDELWYFPDGEYTKNRLMVWFSLGVGFVGGVIGLFITIIFFDRIPHHFYPIIPTVAFVVPAITFWGLERGILNAEQQYPGFIRGLGAIESVKQTSTENVLKTLKDKDFGRLSKYITRLYRRLFLAVNSRKSWNRFSAEVGSSLIKRFTDMYFLGRKMGGSPEKLGDIISGNFRKVNHLRQKRRTMKRKIAGMMYGTTVATSFAFFASFEILKVMVELGEEVEDAEFADSLLYASVYNMTVVESALFITIIFNCLAVAVIVRKIGRMHLGGALGHIMLLIVINFLTGYGVYRMSSEFFAITTLLF